MSFTRGIGFQPVRLNSKRQAGSLSHDDFLANVYSMPTLDEEWLDYSVGILRKSEIPSNIGCRETFVSFFPPMPSHPVCSFLKG